jgi:hypothetical protein
MVSGEGVVMNPLAVAASKSRTCYIPVLFNLSGRTRLTDRSSRGKKTES